MHAVSIATVVSASADVSTGRSERKKRFHCPSAHFRGTELNPKLL